MHIATSARPAAVVTSISIVVLIAAACSSSTTPPACATTITASDDLRFAPTNATVGVGAPVCWKNSGTLQHVLYSDAEGSIGVVLPGQIVAHTFKGSGTFRYVCVLHAGMAGTVSVGSPFFERQR